MRLVTAIIRSITLEKIVKGLKEIGIKGITITEIKGLGEETHLYRPYTIHDKIEIVVPDEKVEEVVDTIQNLARIGQPGDGVILIQKVKELIKIRTGERPYPHNL